MIRAVSGNILNTQAAAIVNPVNTKGVMGAGLARALKVAHPHMFTGYTQARRCGDLTIGTVWTYWTGTRKPNWIICLPTKEHWRNPSQLGWIETGLVALRKELIDREIPTVAIPALGCGHGGLEWEPVRELIYAVMDGMDVELYSPGK